jgi:hypothetical protein
VASQIQRPIIPRSAFPLRATAALVVVLALVRSTAGPLRIGHDAYVWQRQWTPAVVNALATNADLFGVWHVLVAEIAASGRVVPSQADWRQIGTHAVVPVVRIEGPIDPPRATKLVTDIAALVGGLPPALRGRVEIDHDSATSQLASYARFLRALRAALAPGTELTVTVLPTWLSSTDFTAVAAEAALLVIQVHAIDDPRAGLFDPDRATRWIGALARRTRRPFLVALPAYGARVAASPSGRLLAVSAEMHAMDGQAGTEIAASPVAIAGFLERLQRDPPASLHGIVWFRLPTTDDRRSWSPATLRAVVLGQTPRPRIEVVVRPGWTGGMSDILLINTGEADGPLPRAVRLPAGCAAADGIGQYELDGSRLRHRGEGSGLLAAGASAAIGWMRCGATQGDLHVED